MDNYSYGAYGSQLKHISFLVARKNLPFTSAATF